MPQKPTNQFVPEQPTPDQTPGRIEIITDIPPEQQKSPEAPPNKIQFLTEPFRIVLEKKSNLQISIDRLSKEKEQLLSDLNELIQEVVNAQNDSRLTDQQKAELPPSIIESINEKKIKIYQINSELFVSTELLEEIVIIEKDILAKDKDIAAEALQSAKNWQSPDKPFTESPYHKEVIDTIVQGFTSFIESYLKNLEEQQASKLNDNKIMMEEMLRTRMELARDLDISEPIIAMILTGKIPEKQHPTGQPPEEIAKNPTQTISEAVENIDSIENDIGQEITQAQKEVDLLKTDIKSAEDQKTEITNNLGPLKDEAAETKKSLDQNFSQTEDLTNKK